MCPIFFISKFVSKVEDACDEKAESSGKEKLSQCSRETVLDGILNHARDHLSDNFSTRSAMQSKDSSSRNTNFSVMLRIFSGDLISDSKNSAGVIPRYSQI